MSGGRRNGNLNGQSAAAGEPCLPPIDNTILGALLGLMLELQGAHAQQGTYRSSDEIYVIDSAAQDVRSVSRPQLCKMYDEITQLVVVSLPTPMRRSSSHTHTLYLPRGGILEGAGAGLSC